MKASAGNPTALEQQRDVEFHVGLQRAIGLRDAEHIERLPLDGLGKGETSSRGGPAGQPAHGGLEDLRAQIAGAIDAMTEPHQPAPFAHLALQPCLRITSSGDRVEHRDNRPRRATMQPPLQRAQPGEHRAPRAGTRR